MTPVTTLVQQWIRWKIFSQTQHYNCLQTQSSINNLSWSHSIKKLSRQHAVIDSCFYLMSLIITELRDSMVTAAPTVVSASSTSSSSWWCCWGSSTPSWTTPWSTSWSMDRMSHSSRYNWCTCLQSLKFFFAGFTPCFSWWRIQQHQQQYQQQQ